MANGIFASIDMTDHTKEVLEAMAQQVANGLEAIGGEMERHAKEGCPVDTGRLRNSITFATSTMQSEANTNKDPKGQTDAKPEDYTMHGAPGKFEVVVGTNVEYAAENEYYHKDKKHFLKNAAANHSADYKNILKAALDA